jgi:hypothetical protein
VHFDCADGPVKGFIFPDFASTALYLATSNKVLALSDDGTSASETWSLLSIPSPSTPLLTPGEPRLYVGSSDGSNYQPVLLSGPPPTIIPLTLGDGTAGIGSSSLDVSDSMICVGSESGTVCSIVVPYCPPPAKLGTLSLRSGSRRWNPLEENQPPGLPLPGAPAASGTPGREPRPRRRERFPPGSFRRA